MFGLPRFGRWLQSLEPTAVKWNRIPGWRSTAEIVDDKT
jgi:hypothetical protein